MRAEIETHAEEISSASERESIGLLRSRTSRNLSGAMIGSKLFGVTIHWSTGFRVFLAPNLRDVRLKTTQPLYLG